MKRMSMVTLGIAVVSLIVGAAAPAYAHSMGAGGAAHGYGMTPQTADYSHSSASSSSMRESGTSAKGTMASKTNATLAAKNPGEILSQNTRLAAKLTELLPPNSDLQKEAQGFKNLGDFVAAVHVSHDLNIPWTELRTKLVGGETLGQAIKELDPQANSKAEMRKARSEAKKDVSDTMSTT